MAGCEAAWRCAAAGLEVVVTTTSLDTVHNLASDAATLRVPAGSLLQSVSGAEAGEAVALRSWDLHRGVKYALEAHPLIHLLQSTVADLLYDEQGRVVGASTWEGIDRRAALTALCVGSFLRARLRTGAVTETQGKLSEVAYDDLYENLVARGFEFVPVSFSGAQQVGALAYTVESVALHSGEREEGSGHAGAWASSALWRAPNLFAAGVCVAPPGEGRSAGSLTYQDVVEQGMLLGAELVERSAGS